MTDRIVSTSDSPPPEVPDAPDAPDDSMMSRFLGAMQHSAYARFALGNVLSLLGVQMKFGAVSWEVYDRSDSLLLLGMVGLVQVVPMLALFLPAGHFIDRFDRRLIILLGLIATITTSLGLSWISFTQSDVRLVFPLLALHGMSRAFQQPAKSAYYPNLVPVPRYASAVMWNSGLFQFSSVAGPAVAGLLIKYLGGAGGVYLIDAAWNLIYVGVLFSLPASRPNHEREPMSMRSLFAGLRFVWSNKVLLSAISLDLFAVLLGGATALVPVYARDILRVESDMYGLLKAAQGVGAIGMSIALASLPSIRKAGRTLLWSVAAFGVATIIFGVSRSATVAFVALFLIGAFDMVSVIVRQTLMQLLTPDGLRGRVSAVNGLFISMSNELGELESAFVAEFARRVSTDPAFGPTFSVVSGGIGTLIVVVIVAVIAPELRRYGRLDGSQSQKVVS